MIAKISTATNISGGLGYNLKKIEKGEAYVLVGSNILLNTDEKQKTFEKEISQEFSSHLAVLQKRGRTKKPIVHISLNPSPNDNKVDDVTYAYMVDDYLKEMGFENQPFVVFKHEDIDRHHIHILTTNVKADGTKIDDSFSHRRSMAATRGLEEKYGLIPVDQHSKSIQPFVSADTHVFNLENENTKAQIKQIADYVNDRYHFETDSEYKALMRLFGLHAEFSKDESDEKHSRGVVFYGLNSSGERVTEPIEASTIQKGLFKKIKSKIFSKKTKKALSDPSVRQSLKGKLDFVKTAASKKDFYKKLSEKNIDIVFRQNEAGRIYGATVVDHDFGVVLNGSKIGKDYSANVFNHLFSSFGSSSDGLPFSISDGFVVLGGSGGIASNERVGGKSEESETDKINRQIKKRKKKKSNI